MPGFDRMGPEGTGPMTGWGRGRCAQYGRRAGRRDLGSQAGWSVRRGRGKGWRHCAGGSPRWGRDWFGGLNFSPSYAREDEMAVLKEEAVWLKEELSSIERRLKELESRPSNAN